MSSSSKTSLGLNMWVGSDKPKREDFCRDNEITDKTIAALQSTKADKTAEIPFNSDLNSYVTEGEFSSIGGASAHIQHLPSSFKAGTSFHLSVKPTNSYGKGVIQTITAPFPLETCHRAYAADGQNTWGSWVKSADIYSGTWTPIIYGATAVGMPTYVYQTGEWQIIGNRIFLTADIGISGTGNMGGALKIGGLPDIPEKSVIGVPCYIFGTASAFQTLVSANKDLSYLSLYKSNGTNMFSDIISADLSSVATGIIDFYIKIDFQIY
ncbi:MAG: pyocin knob domain-containing protein [Hydrogenoanaerobacterium sp.]